MTALCGGGASELKPGYGTATVVTMAAIEAALTFLSEGTARILAPAIAGATWDLTQVCSTDPPADPGLTAQDALDILNFADPSVSLPAVAKARQWFLSWYWYLVCQCSTVATPAPPTPSNPGNVGTTNPGLPSGPAVACWQASVTVNHVLPTEPGNEQAAWEFPSDLLPPGAAIDGFSLDGNIATMKYYAIPAGTTHVTLSGSFDGHGGSRPGQVSFFYCDDTGTPISGAGHNIAVFGTGPLNGFSQAIPAGATHWMVAVEGARNTTDPPQTITFNLTLVTECGTGGLNDSPCCPPDPTVDTRLNQLLGLVTAIYQSLPTPINSYAEGTVHADLSGHGSFVLADDALALKVEITTQSPPIGQLAGTPVTYLDAGWITPIAAEAPLASIPLHHSPQLLPLPTLTEQIGYTLAVGEVIRITELVRGP